MILARPTLQQSCLRADTVRASQFCALIPPLRVLKFKPHASVLAIMPDHQTFSAFTFRGPRGLLCIYFERCGAYQFSFRTSKNTCGFYRSAVFYTLHDFETALARFFKIKPFTPATRPVIDWPLHRPLTSKASR